MTGLKVVHRDGILTPRCETLGIVDSTTVGEPNGFPHGFGNLSFAVSRHSKEEVARWA